MPAAISVFTPGINMFAGSRIRDFPGHLLFGLETDVQWRTTKVPLWVQVA